MKNEFDYLITDSDIVYYFTGFYEQEGFLVISENKMKLYVDDRYYTEAVEKISEKCSVINTKDQSLKEYLKTCGKKLGLMKSATNLLVYDDIQKSGIEVVDVESEILELTSVKREDELNLIRKSCEVCKKSFAELVSYIRKRVLDEGKAITENELAAYLEFRFRMNGAEGTSFDTIVAFGKNAAIPHHKTDSTVLEKDQVILVDCGCKVGGYCSDMTRTMFYGNPDSEFLEAYEAVKDAHLKAYENIRPKMPGTEADGLARDYLESKGLGKYFTHSLGHGIGIKIHESPRLSLKSKNILDENMVFSIEPGVYIPGKFGIRIENTVKLSKKCVSLFDNSIDLMII